MATTIPQISNMLSLVSLSLVASLLASQAVAAPKACVGTISSLDDVSDAVKCTTVNINSFTVPAGKTFSLSLASGSTVNMRTSLPEVV